MREHLLVLPIIALAPAAFFACGSKGGASPAEGDAATDAGAAQPDADAPAPDGMSDAPLPSATVVIPMVGDPAHPSQPLVLTGIQVSASGIYVTGRQSSGAQPDSFLIAFPRDDGGAATVLADCEKGAQTCMGDVSLAGVAIQGASLYTTVAITNGGAGDVYELPIDGDGGSLRLTFASMYMNYGPQHCLGGVGCGLAANATKVCWANHDGAFCLPPSPATQEVSLFVPPAGASLRAIAMDDASFFTTELQGTTSTVIGGSLTTGASWVVASNAPASSMAVDDTDVYWLAFDGCSISRAPKQGGGAATSFFSQCVGIAAIAVDAASLWFVTTSGAVERVPK